MSLSLHVSQPEDARGMWTVYDDSYDGPGALCITLQGSRRDAIEVFALEYEERHDEPWPGPRCRRCYIPITPAEVTDLDHLCELCDHTGETTDANDDDDDARTGE